MKNKQVQKTFIFVFCIHNKLYQCRINPSHILCFVYLNLTFRNKTFIFILVVLWCCGAVVVVVFAVCVNWYRYCVDIASLIEVYSKMKCMRHDVTTWSNQLFSRQNKIQPYIYSNIVIVSVETWLFQWFCMFWIRHSSNICAFVYI